MRWWGTNASVLLVCVVGCRGLGPDATEVGSTAESESSGTGETEGDEWLREFANEEDSETVSMVLYDGESRVLVIGATLNMDTPLGWVASLDAQSGEVEWKSTHFQLDATEIPYPLPVGAMTGDGELVVAANVDAETRSVTRIVRLDRDGELVWEAEYSGEDEITVGSGGYRPKSVVIGEPGAPVIVTGARLKTPSRRTGWVLVLEDNGDERWRWATPSAVAGSTNQGLYLNGDLYVLGGQAPGTEPELEIAKVRRFSEAIGSLEDTVDVPGVLTPDPDTIMSVNTLSGGLVLNDVIVVRQDESFSMQVDSKEAYSLVGLDTDFAETWRIPVVGRFRLGRDKSDLTLEFLTILDGVHAYDEDGQSVGSWATGDQTRDVEGTSQWLYFGGQRLDANGPLNWGVVGRVHRIP